MAKLTLQYPDVLQLIGAYAVTQRTESRQFLAWFLRNYYRLDETDVDDCICDGPDDKTIDAIYVNDPSSEIHVFQSRLVKSPKGIGDSGLKEFYGARAQFSTRKSVENLRLSTKNRDLHRILTDSDVAEKVEKGYEVKLVFVTNSTRDHNAIAYLKSVSDLQVYDEPELQKYFVPIDKTEPIAEESHFDVSGVQTMEYPMGASLKMAVAPIAASELVRMKGIVNGELFAYNVRQWLRKTKVNDDIEDSIEDQAEHQLFPAFHNGITILCKKLVVTKERVTISGYAVVNGCQSLNSLYKHKDQISSDLRIMAKFIQTPPDGKIAAKITDHTNNQNGTTARDLQSNNLIQIRLQSEINGAGEFKYRIKQGEHPDWPASEVIENVLAAKILLAFDRKEPWSCHQTYKLFDELHSDIFARPDVCGSRIVVLFKVYKILLSKLELFDNQLFAQYKLSHFFLLYILRLALEYDALGKEFCDHPEKFVSTKQNQAQLVLAIDRIAQVVARIANMEVKRRDADKDNPFDFKKDLKSPAPVHKLDTAMITAYQVLADTSDNAITFGKLWNLKAAKKSA